MDYNQIDQAAHGLTQAGIAVTVDNIRHALGNKGSKSTLAPLVKRWKENNQVIAQTVELGVPASLLNAVKGVYDGIRAEFTQQLAEKTAEFEAKMSELTRIHEDLQAKNHDLTQANAKMMAENQDFAQTQHELNTHIATLNNQNTHLQEKTDFLSKENESQKNHFKQQYQTLQSQFLHYQNHAEQQRQMLQTNLQNAFTQSTQELKANFELILSEQGARFAAENTQLLEKITAQNLEIHRLKRENNHKSRHHWQAKYRLK